MQGGQNSQRCRGLARNIAATRSPCAALSSGIAGQSLHERLAVTFAEPIEQLAKCSGRSGRPEFGAKGDDPQRRQPG